jgi:hypothetical protein
VAAALAAACIHACQRVPGRVLLLANGSGGRDWPSPVVAS